MRTVAFVLVMLLVAVVAGLSFVVRVGAEPATPTASAPTTARVASTPPTTFRLRFPSSRLSSVVQLPAFRRQAVA